MGYYTQYTLDIVPNNEEIKQEFIDNTGFVEDDKTKWCDHEKDSVEISSNNKGYLIVVTGKGEDSGDVWKKAFVSGKKVWEWKLDDTMPDVPNEIKEQAMNELRIVQRPQIEARLKQLEEEKRKLRQILDKE